MLQKEVDISVETAKVVLENTKTVIPRAKKKPINFRETKFGADIEYHEKKLPKPYPLDNEL